MRVLLTPRKWVQIKPSRRHAEARVGPESDRHTGPESDCHRQTHVEAATSGLAPFAQTVVPLGQSVTELSDALMALLGRLNDFLA